MTILRFNAILSPFKALRSPRGFVNAIMLGRAVHSHASKPQKALQTNPSAINASRPNEPNKRKFERTMSSTTGLGALHAPTVYFDENDFDDDAAIDLTGTPPDIDKPDVQYPSLNKALNEITYPKLPHFSGPKQIPSSSVPVPWSQSPPEHYSKPSSVRKNSQSEEEEIRPSKRRTVPWLDKSETNTPKASFTPLPQKQSNGSSYPWNNTASAMKNKQKELRKRNKIRTQQIKPDLPRSSIQKIPTAFLSDEQRGIVKAVVEDGKSVFFTGSAGTGKSVLMRSIIAKLREKYVREPDRIAVTASTGLAACVIEGITLHSFAGIGIGRDPAPELIKKIKRNVSHKTRWLRTKVLIVDEISMVDGDLFDKLEQIARAIRNNGRPFGGIQLVVTGDFFQLPPVPDRNQVAKFAFDAATWNTSIEHTILLTNVFRQKDPTFANMLNELRLGKMTPMSIKAFQRLSRPLAFEDNIECTELFPTRAEVENANGSRMKNLSGQEMVYTAIDSGAQEATQRAKTLSNFMAQETLILKKGAQVMLIKNMDGGLVNGSTGKVVAFMHANDYSFYTEHEETFNRAHVPDNEGDDEEKAENAKARMALQLARYKYDKPTGPALPMVRFTLADNTSRDMLIHPEEFKTEAPGGEILAKRSQIPLILAWALSIHKAQGQTLERVKVNLGRVFEKGQAYVALSRATNQGGLQVNNFDPRKVMVHQKVIQFYDNLVSFDAALKKREMKGDSAAAYERRFVETDDDEEEFKHVYG